MISALVHFAAFLASDRSVTPQLRMNVASMSPQTYDFTRPPRLPTEIKTRMASWLHRSHGIFAESLGELGLPLTTKLLDQSTVWPLATLEGLTGKPVGIRIDVDGSPTILVLPNLLAQSMVAGLLGDSVTAEAVERDLSAVENNLLKLAVETFVSSLREAWLDESVITLAVRDRETNLRRSKVFRPTESLVQCRSTVTVMGTEHIWSWLLRLESLLDIFGTDLESKAPAPNESQRRKMETVVRDMNLSVTVHLGHAQLSPAQLRSLQVGDVVVLHQRTSEPLKALIAGKPAFLGWPGQIGNRQAFQIESELAK